MSTKAVRPRKSSVKNGSRRAKAKVAASCEPKTLYDLFRPFIGIIKDGPRDLAENHKLYASGAKQWK